MNSAVVIGTILVILVILGVIALGVAIVNRKQVKSGQRPQIGEGEPTSTDEAAHAGAADQAEGAPAQEPTGAPAAEAQPTVETPEASTSRLARLRRRLANSNNALARGLAELLSSDHIDEDTWDDFETTLITSDLGVGPSTELVEKLRSELAIDGVADPQRARTVLHDELVTLVNPDMDRELKLDHEEGKPAVILMVGVNGTGKTTTCGKIARMLVADGKSVVLGAADTFLSLIHI